MAHINIIERSMFQNHVGKQLGSCHIRPVYNPTPSPPLPGREGGVTPDQVGPEAFPRHASFVGTKAK